MPARARLDQRLVLVELEKNEPSALPETLIHDGAEGYSAVRMCRAFPVSVRRGFIHALVRSEPDGPEVRFDPRSGSPSVDLTCVHRLSHLLGSTAGEFFGHA